MRSSRDTPYFPNIGNGKEIVALPRLGQLTIVDLQGNWPIVRHFIEKPEYVPGAAARFHVWPKSPPAPYWGGILVEGRSVNGAINRLAGKWDCVCAFGCASGEWPISLGISVLTNIHTQYEMRF